MQTIHRSTISTRSIVSFVAAALTFAGCGGGDKTAPVTQVLTSLTITAPLTTISQGAATQLTANAKDQLGAPMVATVTWSSSASGTASVSGSGLVTGVAAGSSATITATAVAGGVTVTNTVLMTVVVPVLTSVTIQAPSTSVDLPGTLQLASTAKDQNGSLIAATVTWTSSTPGVATVGSTTGLVTSVAVGTDTITASATAGGVTVTSKQVITVVTFSSSANINANANLTFDPTAVDITAGGTVTWTFFSVAHNVTFSAATGVPANIATMANGTASRTFPTAGTFNFTCTIHPFMTGTVTVH